MSYDAYLVINTGVEWATVEDIGNMTSNLVGMWRKALTETTGEPLGLADLEGMSGADAAKLLGPAVTHIRAPEHAGVYARMNPENGWGNHEHAAAYLEKILAACVRHPLAKLHFSR